MVHPAILHEGLAPPVPRAVNWLANTTARKLPDD
jgi:hypothetical protein